MLALMATCGTEVRDASGPRLILASDQPAVARLCFRLAKEIFDQPELRHRQREAGRHYEVAVPLVEHAGLAPSGFRACCRRHFLRAAFLGCGSMVDPERAYHLEFATDAAMAEVIVGVLERDGIHAGSCPRLTGGMKVYLKGSEEIARLLTLMGGHQATLRLEELRVSRELRNQVQRTVNCETANLARTVTSAERQIADIQRLAVSTRWRKLPADLLETAQLRLAEPYASLAELAGLHDPPVSKSAVNHRLRRLGEEATLLSSEETG